MRTIFTGMRTPVGMRAARVPRSSAPRQVRWASSTTEKAAEKASTTASTAQKKAQEGFEKALEVGRSLTSSITGRLGTMLGAYREPLTYNFSVARELLKQVYIAERLQPPTSVSTITHAYSTLWGRATNVSYWREVVQSGEWARVGVYAVEAYGIFKIGEIVGRRSLIGYNLN